MAEIFVGSVSVTLVPDARGWDQKVRDQTLEPSRKVGNEIGAEMTRAIASSLDIGKALSDAVLAGSADIIRAGERAAKDFADAAKLKIKEEFAGLDVHANLKLDTGGAKADWEKFKTETEKGKGIVAKLAIDTKTASQDIASVVTKGFQIAGQVAGGSGGSAGNLAATGAAGAASGGGGILSFLYGGPQAIITGPATVAAVAYLGQVFAGAAVTALGGGLAALGILGAIRNAGVQKSFGNFTNIAGTALTQIGTPFINPIENVLKTAGQVTQKNVPTLNNAIATISAPLQDFVNTILTAFTKPEVQKSIQAVAESFAAILNAITPDVTKGMVAIANSITDMANNIAKNPKAFSNFVEFLFGVANGLIRIVDVATEVGNFFEKPGGIFQTIESFVESPFGNQPVNWATNPLGGIIAALGSFLTPGGAVNKQLMKIGGDIWNGVLSGIDTAVKATGKWITTNVVNPLINWMTAGFGIGSPAKVMIPIGQDIVAGLLAGILTAWTSVKNFFTKTVPQNVSNWFSTAKTWLVTHGSDLISGLWSGITSFWNGTVKPFFTGLPGRLQGYFVSAINWLWDAGWNIASGIGTGISSFLSTIDNTWVDKNIFQPLKKAVFNYFGMGSPAKKTMPWGANIITGIVSGMVAEGKNIKTFAAKIFGSWPQAIAAVFSKGTGINLAGLSASARNMLTSIFGSVAAVPNALGKAGQAAWSWISSGKGNVTQWAATVSQALQMLKLPQSLTGQVLYQIQTESGGNPRAINLWDSNARAGNPSRGLLQTTGTTFAQYHVPGTSGNIYDPLANIAAAINYAEHRYGQTLMRGGTGLGSGRGYDLGGWLPTGVTTAYNLTGRPERILSPDELAAWQAGNSGPTYNAHFDGLTGSAIESHVRTAFQLMSMTEGNLYRQGRRS
jgi:hypothetical protein